MAAPEAEIQEKVPKIINLSSHVLSDSQKTVLLKGLKFTPTPSFDMKTAKQDVCDFTRKLRLKEYFHERDVDDGSIVRNPSNFTPDKGNDTQLNTYIEFLNKAPVGQKVGKYKKSNLQSVEHVALNELKNNNEIIIKEADKGAAIVLMNKTYYEENMLEMLNDKSTYEPITSNQDRAIMNKIKHHVQQNGQSLTKSEKEYLTHFEAKTSQFYGLPKIHKSQQIIDAIKKTNSECVELQDPNDLKFRPIVAGPACPTHRLSHLMDLILKPFVKHVDSYIRDDIDFLNHLPENISDEEVFVSFDVTSLYSNITHNLGLEAIEYWINKYPNDINERFSKFFILGSIQIILENNTFEFGPRNFKQILGTAMGTKFAPNYATLTLAYLENKLYSTIEQIHGPEFSIHIKSTLKRFLDDVFIIWDSSKGNLQEFLDLLNSMHPKIIFTMQMDHKELPFLDVLVIRKAGKIVTDIYYKPTDTKQYLNFFSCHPRHTKSNVPYNLARRICSIITDEPLRDKRLSELKDSLVKCNYPSQLITQGINRAKQLDKFTLRTPRQKQETDTITYIETFNPNYKSFSQTINSTLPFLNKSEKMQQVLKNTKVIHAKRQPPNLKSILTRAKLPQPDKIFKTSKCGNKRCKCCMNIIETSSYYFRDLDLHFEIRADMNCNSKNLIYVLFCNSCNARYVGQSGCELRSRATGHRQNIREKDKAFLYVSKHIGDCAHSMDPPFRILPIYKMKSENEEERLKMERHFIIKLKPSLNRQL